MAESSEGGNSEAAQVKPFQTLETDRAKRFREIADPEFWKRAEERLKKELPEASPEVIQKAKTVFVLGAVLRNLAPSEEATSDIIKAAEETGFLTDKEVELVRRFSSQEEGPKS